MKFSANHNQKSTLARRVMRKMKLIAAVAAVGMGFGSVAKAAVDVTSISTTTLVGAASAETNVLGYGPFPVGPANNFPGNQAYNLTYNGNIQRVDVLHTSQGDYNASIQATAVIRRFHGPNNDMLWFKGTGIPSNPNIVLESQKYSSFEQAFNANNLLVGSDNLFVNTGNGSGDNTNVERLDNIFAGGITASSDKGFAVFDRGVLGDHDKFRIALITGYNAGSQLPTAYSTALTFAHGTWGNTSLGTDNYIVMRTNNDIPGDTMHPAAYGSQQLGATFIKLTDLVPAGTTIYGYSLLAGDTTGNGGQLVDWTNTTYYPSTTADTTLAGGIDAIGVSGVLYTSVPEPTSLGLLAGATGLLLRRRRR